MEPSGQKVGFGASTGRIDTEAGIPVERDGSLTTKMIMARSRGQGMGVAGLSTLCVARLRKWPPSYGSRAVSGPRWRRRGITDLRRTFRTRPGRATGGCGGCSTAQEPFSPELLRRRAAGPLRQPFFETGHRADPGDQRTERVVGDAVGTRQ
jgi:hypothetical protein